MFVVSFFTDIFNDTLIPKPNQFQIQWMKSQKVIFK